jgi:hypothetical protein
MQINISIVLAHLILILHPPLPVRLAEKTAGANVDADLF